MAGDTRLCVPVDRPFGAKGLTLTPRALLKGDKILVLAAGQSKAEAVRRVVRGQEPLDACPARLLSEHPDVTLLLDERAAALL
ncbi:MAG: 6-phosphogluconolactonase [Actinomycetota bacterium]|nr:6-phosphogluconolactonase [Actinomycetota bacterium]